MARACYVMIGGFLGAGKTTAVLQIARRLAGRGLSVGLITNDQSFGLVDTAMLASQGFPVEEITGGCFCCRFQSLVNAAESLAATTRPDVFLAEPVGSCTDLKATVDYPLRRMYGDDYRVAPLSVMVDPIRALRILGLDPGKNFSPRVTYIYEKQLEEADLIVINKLDLLPPDRLDTLHEALAERFPGAEVVRVAARDGVGIDGWLTRIEEGAAGTGAAMDVDYDTYAEGEALLGWLNATLDLSAADAFDGNALLEQLAGRIHRRLARAGVEIAHLKLTLTPDEDGRDIGVVNCVRSDRPPEASHRLYEPLESGELLLNLRAEAAPEFLRDVVEEELSAPGEARISTRHLEAFRPGRPVPTYRLAAA